MISEGEVMFNIRTDLYDNCTTIVSRKFMNDVINVIIVDLLLNVIIFFLNYDELKK